MSKWNTLPLYPGKKKKKQQQKRRKAKKNKKNKTKTKLKTKKKKNRQAVLTSETQVGLYWTTDGNVTSFR
jgi:hypothetical protein